MPFWGYNIFMKNTANNNQGENKMELTSAEMIKAKWVADEIKRVSLTNEFINGDSEMQKKIIDAAMLSIGQKIVKMQNAILTNEGFKKAFSGLVGA
jgi:hypothetical protein